MMNARFHKVPSAIQSRAIAVERIREWPGRNRGVTLRLLLLAVLVSVSAIRGRGDLYADTIALSPDTSTASNFGNTGTFGWEFTPSVSIQVTSVGWFDGGFFQQNGDGFIEAHEIGIWDGGENLLTSATVPAGVGATLENDFRYVPIATLSLSANETYIIAGTHTANVDLTISPFAAKNPAAELSLGGGKLVNNTGTLEFPMLSTSLPIVGPNFQFTVVPEPSSIALAAVAVVGLIALGRRETGSSCGRVANQRLETSHCGRPASIRRSV